MQPEEITTILINEFGDRVVQHESDDTWQVETPEFRLLVIINSDYSGVRLLVPICPASQAQPYFEQLLEANFASSQFVHYGLHQEVLWGIFSHQLQTLTPQDFKSAITELLILNEQKLSQGFNLLIEKQISLIIKAAKQQGQSLEATLQSLNRFYAEGMLGGLSQAPEEREQFLAAWQYQLERLWNEEN